METINVDLLSRAINCPVLKMPERKYPGILIQGDSFKSLLGIAERINRVQVSNDIEEMKDAIQWLLEESRSYMEAYESAMQLYKLQLPYVKQDL